jgi:hypothetical protein
MILQRKLSITLTQPCFRIVEANNVWTLQKVIEKAVILDGYLGTFSSKQIPLKSLFEEKTCANDTSDWAIISARKCWN